MSQSQKIQRCDSLQKVQNGRTFHPEGNYSTSRFYDKNRLAQGIPTRASAPTLPKIHAICMEKGTIPISGTTLRATERPPNFHKSPETATRNFTLSRDKNSSLSRRPNNFVPLSKSGTKRLKNSHRSANEGRIFAKRQKVSLSSVQKDGISWSPSEHKKDDTGCSQKETKEILQRSQTNLEQNKKTYIHHTQEARWLDRKTKLPQPSDGRHRAPHSGSPMGVGEGNLQCSGPQPLLGKTNTPSSTSTRTNRSGVVGNKSSPLERSHYTTNQKSRYNNIYGCLRNRLCGGLADSTQAKSGHKGNLDVTRSQGTFDKRPRTPGDLSYNTRSHKTQKMETQKNFSLHRQYGLKMGHKQTNSKIARHVCDFAKTDDDVFEVRRSHNSQSHSREGQCNGRYTLPQRQRRQRLATTPNHFSKPRQHMGSPHSRLDSNEAEHPATTFLQLDVRSKSNLRRRFEVPQPSRKRVFKPPLFPYRSNSASCQSSPSNTDTHSTGLEDPTLVAGVNEHVYRFSPNTFRPPTAKSAVGKTQLKQNFQSISSSNTTQLSIRSPPSPAGNDIAPPPMGGGRLSYIRRNLEGQGFSEKVLDLVTSAWQSSTVSTYESPWRAWVDYCADGAHDPTAPDPAAFCGFLSEGFAEGKSFSKTNTSASSIATALHLGTGVNLSDHPVVILLRKAMRKERPVKSRYTDTWDVGILFKYLDSLGNNSTLSLETLTLKVCCLLKVDLFGRASDLARAFRSEVIFGEGFVKLRFYLTKEWRHDGKFVNGRFTKWLVIGKYSSNSRICTVSTLRYYFRKTQGDAFAEDRSVEGKATRGLVSSLVTAKKGPHNGKFFSLSSQRISKYVLQGMQDAGIDISKYKAHSTRSAASSMARDAGASMDKVLQHARMSSQETFEKFYFRSVAHFKKKKVPVQASLAYFIRASV